MNDDEDYSRITADMVQDVEYCVSEDAHDRITIGLRLRDGRFTLASVDLSGEPGRMCFFTTYPIGIF
jgi:hypothetical protein